MHKTLVQTLLAAFCAILATAPLEGGGVMLINMRNAIFGGAKLSAKSYVQDGLVAMWDGIENAGWGVHDASASTWKDLVGSNDMTLNQENSAVEDNALSSGSSKSQIWASFSPIASYATLEIVLMAASNAGPCVINPVKQNGWQIVIINGLIGTGINPSADNSKGVSISQEVPMSLTIEKSSVSVTTAIFKNGLEDVNAASLGSWYTVNGGQVGNDGINRSFLGKIYAIRLYSRALTAAEVAANYTVDKARFNLPDATS